MSPRSSRVLVTGAAGFIGRPLTSHLLANGHEVFAVISERASADTLSDLEGDLHVLAADLAKPSAVEDVVATARPEACYHLAWSNPADRYLASVDDNLSSLRTSVSVLHELIAARCKQLVFVGSCIEYELGPVPLREHDATRPRTLYGATKVALATVATAAARGANVALAWPRLFHMYGPREDPRRHVPRIIHSVLEAKPLEVDAQVRDYHHVDDIASALVAIGRSGWNGPINVCSGTPVRLRTIWEQVVSILEAQIESAVAPEVPNAANRTTVVGDPSRLRSLGWIPRFDLVTGLEDTVRWWRHELQSGPPSRPVPKTERTPS